MIAPVRDRCCWRLTESYASGKSSDIWLMELHDTNGYHSNGVRNLQNDAPAIVGHLERIKKSKSSKTPTRSLVLERRGLALIVKFIGK